MHKKREREKEIRLDHLKVVGISLYFPAPSVRSNMSSSSFCQDWFCRNQSGTGKENILQTAFPLLEKETMIDYCCAVGHY